MTTKFVCWKPDHQSREDGHVVEASDAERAAEKHGEDRFYRDSYPNVQEIAVLSPDGTIEVFLVASEMTPHFVSSKCVGREREHLDRLIAKDSTRHDSEPEADDDRS